MEDKDYEDISAGLRASMRRFPGCRVASCNCDEFHGEWLPGCSCPGHWDELNKAFGGVVGDWSFADAAASASAGKPVRAE